MKKRRSRRDASKHKTALDWASDHWFLTFLLASSAIGAVASVLGGGPKVSFPSEQPYQKLPPAAPPPPPTAQEIAGLRRLRY